MQIKPSVFLLILLLDVPSAEKLIKYGPKAIIKNIISVESNLVAAIDAVKRKLS